jgi:cytochrome oxidase Cu insertion factor (SCO1/SenC/PrrC family)
LIEAGRTRPARTLPPRPFAFVVVAAALAGVIGGVALHRLRAAATPVAPALPELHGQAVWAAGERPAPLFTLRDQHGASVALGALRGRPVLLTFLGSRCGSGCAPEARRLASVLRRLPAAERPTLVIVSLDPQGDTPAAIDRAVRRWGLGGGRHWHWLTASRARLASVWRMYGVPAGLAHRLRVFLIDGHGDERTAYLFPFMPAFVEGDLARLAGEHA